MSDPFHLERFVDAQRTAYDVACRELEAGAKQSHWIWYIFPQMRGLGYSATSLRYGITSRAEAEAYLAHPVLGPRLVHATRLMLAIQAKSIAEIMPDPDDLKFHSSMTLFAAVAPSNSEFEQALDRYFEGEPDQQTLTLLRAT